jgi:glycosyltransferase involved in cell wall biosynthesis
MSFSSPLLTIGLSVHNAAADLPMSLGSIFAQTFLDWELLVVDDGSTDHSLEILRQLRDPRVRLLESRGRNLGLAVRLNQIVREARGRYIARMDADDLMHPSRYEKQLASLLQNPKLDAIGCSVVVLDNTFGPNGVRELPLSREGICADPLNGVALAHPTFVGKADWLRAHPYNETNRSCEDWELWFSSYKESCFANLRAPLYFYREFHSYRLRAYLRAKARITMLQWQRRADFGSRRVIAATLMNGMRAAFNCGACALGLQDNLVRRRSGPVTEEARLLVAEALPIVQRHANALFYLPERRASHVDPAVALRCE